MNIGALQAMGIGNPSAVGNTQNTGAPQQPFGAIFAGMTSSVNSTAPVQGDNEITISLEAIQAIFNATNTEELEQAINAIPENGNITMPNDFDATKLMESIEKFSESLSLNAEKLLGTLKKLLSQSGATEAQLAGLSIATDVWTLLAFIDDVGMKFFDKLNESLRTPGKEETQLLTFLKAVEMQAPKTDMVVTVEQKFASFQGMLKSAADQFDQKVSTLAKQEPFHSITGKASFRVVLESEAPTTSANDQGANQKQTETQPHGSNTSHSVVQTVKADFALNQSETNQTSRSESLMREMQALFKRSNFGQVGGSTRMLIKLYPEHLGQVRIELHETNGIMTARILASTALAKGMLESQLHQLKHAFNQQNLQVERIDITQSIQESSRNEREQSFNEQFKQKQQDTKQESGKSSDDKIPFEEFLIELEA